MTWIKTVPLSEANESLLRALEAQRPLYPQEYATPVFRAEDDMAGIVGSHSLIPDALNHAFSTFGVLMSPELPLTRRESRPGSLGFLVEAAGVEPASENVTGQETTCLFLFMPQAFAAL